MTAVPSYSSGISEVPLLGDTIGDNFDRTVQAFGDRDELVDRPTGRTQNPRYFAGGDCVNGGREVVDAVADGKRAALAIMAAVRAGSASREATHG